MKKTKRIISIIMVVLLIIGALTSLIACTKSNPEDGKTSTDGQTDKLQEGESIFRMTADWPTYIDPGVGSKFSDSVELLNIYDTLVFPNHDGTVRPHLATEWDISEDGSTYKFKLRDDVKFHNGNTFTADDVKFSMDRLLTIGEGYAYLFTDTVKEVNVIDDYSVEFKLKKPSGTFLSMLVRLYIADKETVMDHIDSAGTYGEFGDYGKAWLLLNDAGSGPYTVKEVVMEDHVLIEKFEDYWGGWEDGAPNLFLLMGGKEPTTVRTMMSRHELDMTDEYQPQENYTVMSKMEGVDIVRFLNGGMFNMTLNTKIAPTDDVHFRRALAYAMDYPTIVNSIYIGAREAVGPVMASLPGALNDYDGYTFDMAKAEEELKKSKYYNDLDNLVVSLTWCAEATEQEKIALLFQSNLAKLGVKVEITKKPFSSMMTDAQTVETTPNASIVVFSPAYIDAGGVLKSRYHSDSCGTWEQMEWLQDEEIDALIEDALVTVDDAERYEKYKEIQKKLIDLCPTIWLFEMAETRAYRSDYIVWPTAELKKANTDFIHPMGYNHYIHDFKMVK